MAIPHRLYVGTVGEGLFRSTDGGLSFVRACNGMFVECHVRALAIHPKDPQTLYLGNEEGLFLSEDGAENWTRMDSPLNGKQIWSILVVPHSPNTLVIGTCPSRLYWCDSGGRTWIESAAQMVQECPRIMRTRVTTILADPVEPETIWAGVEIDGIHRSRDGGRSFQKVGQGLSSQDIHSLAVVPGHGHPKRLLASTNNDLNYSVNNGETWKPMQIGQTLPWSYCRGMIQACGRPEVVLLGNGDGPPGTVGTVARSEDGGQTWRPAHLPGHANSTIWNFAVHPADPQLIYASSVSGEIYRSTDTGVSWEKPLAREFGEVRSLAWAPQ
ncbi:MAG TPA: hypothetical protein VGY77_09150 [Gemmataceae bacterium]|jgi:photosystem II stability/assembly factor-like uncharacterized protein|nr:hypothetical protein [Gemmataceae bacterium]